jgi:hypothetical protein
MYQSYDTPSPCISFSIRDKPEQNGHEKRRLTMLTMNSYYYQSLHSTNLLQFKSMILEEIITRMQRRAAESAAAEQQAYAEAKVQQQKEEVAAAAQHAATRRAKFNEAMLQLQHKAIRTSSCDYRAVCGLALPVDSRWDSLVTAEAWYSVPNQHTDVPSHPDNAGRDLIMSESQPIRCQCDFDYCLDFCEPIGKTEKPALSGVDEAPEEPKKQSWWATYTELVAISNMRNPKVYVNAMYRATPDWYASWKRPTCMLDTMRNEN